MAETRRWELPGDPVSVGILVVTGLEPLTVAGILASLGYVGAPSWHPSDDVVVGAVDRLRRHGQLAPAGANARGADRLAPTAAARAGLPAVLDALPLSGPSPDIGYKLKVMGLDLLEPAARARQLERLLAHWRSVETLWRDAEERCPCRRSPVRHWMRHSLVLARTEIDWLTTVSIGAAEQGRGR